jgi:cation diffusion facilitator family transporter
VNETERIGRQVAVLSMIVGAALAVMKITVGLMANSAAVVSDGVESASDVLASGIVLFGLALAAKPADEEHPYGHGRFETISGLAVGVMLGMTGAVICFRAAWSINDQHVPAAFAIWALVVSMIAKAALGATKFRIGRNIKSEALVADGWNDTVDILSASAALVAVALAVWRPQRFAAADHYGAFAVGLIVIFLGIRVVYNTTQQLVDRMPPRELLEDIRRVALSVPGALGIEKCLARKTGLRYHVDLHLEVDPEMTVRRSHEIAHEVRNRIIAELPWVADVLVHVEPHSLATIESGPRWRTGK